MRDIILAFAIMGNVFNFAYNIPFVWRVMKQWDANNISKYFLYIRILGSISWIMYSILSSEIFIGLSYSVTLTSSLLVSYVKFTQEKNKNKKIFLKSTKV